MIIRETRKVFPADASSYAWSNLRRFHNVAFVEQQISRLHSLDKSQRENAKKQATQLRYCLLQAKEYFDASKSVTLATQPVLLYYSIMSLALAEILMKQSGDSSLDRARAEHKHHGLELRVSSVQKGSEEIQATASALRAAPLVGASGERFGTFELWHRSCREMPLAGNIETRHSGGGQTQFRVIFLAPDAQLSPLPEPGLSLLDCLRSLPGAMEFLLTHDVTPRIVRGACRVQRQDGDPNKVDAFTVIVHPGPAEVISAFFQNWTVDAKGVDRITFTELPSGGIVRWTNDAVNGPLDMHVPHGSMWTDKEIRFWPGKEPLNEFGYLYVALYIAGNYARYFPDKWLLDVEKSTPLALAIEELISTANVRMPLLALSELTRMYQIAAG